MVGFFIKKSFYDGWDNMFLLLLLNAIILGIGIGGYYLAQLTLSIIPLSVLIVAVFVAIEGVLFLTLSQVLSKTAGYKSFSVADFFQAMKDVWAHGVLYVVFSAALVAIVVIAIPYYVRMGSVLGWGLAMAIFWVAVVCALALQWFMPIRSQLDARFGKCLKKCFIIFFDNPGLTFFLALYSLILLILSCVLVFLLPGFAGLILAQNELFRIVMLKYDWIEAHPGMTLREGRKQVPWGELIAAEDEKVGHRTFRNFIFPWKD